VRSFNDSDLSDTDNTVPFENTTSIYLINRLCFLLFCPIYFLWQLRIVRTGGCWRNMALRAPRGACNNYYYYLFRLIGVVFSNGTMLANYLRKVANGANLVTLSGVIST